MTIVIGIIKELEEDLEEAKRYEEKVQPEQALKRYQEIEKKLLAIETTPGDSDYTEQNRVLAFVLMRQANILRQFGDLEKADATVNLEIEAARASGDNIAIAQSLVSYGTTCVTQGKKEIGLASLDEARELFSKGDSPDHKKGLGWFWIIQADMIIARILPGGDENIIEACTKALGLLEPINNRQGIKRAYEVRSNAYERLGEKDKAIADRQSQANY